MKINNNISAVVSNKHLLRNENYLSGSIEKLSSGYKINHTEDDPSGMAIGAKMRAQIRGLDRASQNSSDGMSVLETADGALNEVTAMLKLKEIRSQRAITQQIVADYLEISRQAYSNYENGKREPDFETLLKLGEFFGVTVDYLLGNDSADDAKKAPGADESTPRARKEAEAIRLIRGLDDYQLELLMLYLSTLAGGAQADHQAARLKETQ